MSLANDLWRLHPAATAYWLTEGKFKRYPHIDYISEMIAQAVTNGGARIIVEVPPRHGKSWLISRWTPPWFLSHFPDRKVVLCSYEADFAASWGRQARNITNEYPVLGVHVMNDSSAADRWDTKHGGGMVTAGARGPITGKGGDLLIIDDPIKNRKDADSPTMRKDTIDWYQSTFRTRAEPNASIIVLSTRWHENDLIGWLLSEENEMRDEWTRVRLPAIAEPNDPLGREIGEPLCPERYDAQALDSLRKSVGIREWNALFQQAPAPDEGEILKPEDFKYYDTLPSTLDTAIQSWDLTFTDNANSDFVAGFVLGRSRAGIFIIDRVHGRFSFTRTLDEIRKLTARYPGATAKYVEKAANGFAVVDTLSKEIQGVIAVKPEGSKIARANAVAPLLEAGNIYLPRNAPWVAHFLHELRMFPNGANDDQVDAFTQGVIELMKRPSDDWMPISVTGVNKFA